MLSAYKMLPPRQLHWHRLKHTVELTFGEKTSPPDLTTGCFTFLLDKEHTGIWLAQNRRRGCEIPGGHVEKNETLVQTAIREPREETGIIITNIIPICYQKISLLEPPPENWRYPHPESYMQFYLGEASGIENNGEYTENDECLYPVFLPFSKETPRNPLADDWVTRKNKVNSTDLFILRTLFPEAQSLKR